MVDPNLNRNRLRVGMIGLGMIFDETYRPLFEQLHAGGLYGRDYGFVDVELAGVASRTGARVERLRQDSGSKLDSFRSVSGSNSVQQLVENDLHVVCVATPDNRHFEAARTALLAGKHVLIEKPSVLTLSELDALQ